MEPSAGRKVDILARQGARLVNTDTRAALPCRLAAPLICGTFAVDTTVETDSSGCHHRARQRTALPEWDDSPMPL
jgi:hypothetical protein